MASLNSGLSNGPVRAVLYTVCALLATVPHSQGHCPAAMGAIGLLGAKFSNTIHTSY